MAKNDCVAPTLTSEIAIDILMKTLEELDTPEVEQKLLEAKSGVGNEMLKMMQFIFPIVMQVQIDVLKAFGFSESKEAIIKFAQMLRPLEREDPEVARLHGLIKAYYLPAVTVSNTAEPTIDERLISN